MSGSIGLGDLVLPYALSQSGLALGAFFIILGALFNLWALNCLGDCGIKAKALNYSDLVLKRFGKVINLI